MEAIRVENAVKSFVEGETKVTAVDDVSLSLAEGEFATLAGPSGSGKTTLLNLIGGLDRPDAGTVHIAGEETSRKTDDELADLRLRHVGFVFQAYNLLPVLTAAENAEFVQLIQGVDPDKRRTRVEEVFETLGIGGLEDRYPSQMSGGQQQRVAVARAVAAQPAIILADEPTANLDSESAKLLLSMMRRLNQEKGVTFLFSTHDPMVIEQASRVIRMRDGKIIVDENKGAAETA